MVVKCGRRHRDWQNAVFSRDKNPPVVPVLLFMHNSKLRLGCTLYSPKSETHVSFAFSEMVSDKPQLHIEVKAFTREGLLSEILATSCSNILGKDEEF